MPRVAMLGCGLIGDFYTRALHGRRGRDQVTVAYSRTEARAQDFCDKYGIPRATTDLNDAVNDDSVDAVIVALPNHRHEEAVVLAAEAGKAVFCTKPLGRTADEALRMLEAVEQAGVFHGYLEDLVYTPKTLQALEAVGRGAIGRVLWVRSRETHPGPHSDWFWNKELAGGGAIIDMGCHCIEIARSFIGKDIRPVEVFCWGDTQVHPIDAEDHAVGMVRYANGAIGQFEVSWCFRGGMDLRDEVAGDEGVVWLNHWQRTGAEMFTAAAGVDYVSEKAESNQGWLFPVGDEVSALGYADMFLDMFDALDENRTPTETFYDGYVVNAIVDAAYRSIKAGRWEPVELPVWRGREDVRRGHQFREFDQHHFLVKEERMPDGKKKRILKHKETGQVTEETVDD